MSIKMHFRSGYSPRARQIIPLCRVVSLWIFAVFLACPPVRSQQVLSFTIGGKTYRAQFSWMVKQSKSEARSKTTHNLYLSAGQSFDLSATFKFENDSIPADQNVVWGFQFAQNGDLITPGSNEKKSRSFTQFQRFNMLGTGQAGLNITPKVWLRNPTGFEVLTQAAPVLLAFNISETLPAASTEGAPVPATENTPGTSAPRRDSALLHPLQTLETPEMTQVYTMATSMLDSIQRIKALIDFVKKFSPTKPKAELVTKAIKDIPLSTSVPESKGADTYTYTLDYAINPVVDTSHVRGWRWELSQGEFGQYKLVLTDLKDSVHTFRIADLGKNAPFNRPKDLHPFENIRIRFLGETRDSFRIQASGGSGPYIVFLSQDGFTKERYIMEKSDTIWTFSKIACSQCANGPHTIEVYDTDFSTLLLREENAVHIRHFNRVLLALAALGLAIAFWFVLKWLKHMWGGFQYRRKLREIESWEKKEAEDWKKRKQR